MWKRIASLMAASVLALSPCIAQDAADDFDSGGGENASNPLSKVKNTDVRIQYLDNKDGSERWDYWLADGAFMATDKVRWQSVQGQDLRNWPVRGLWSGPVGPGGWRGHPPSGPSGASLWEEVAIDSVVWAWKSVPKI